MVPHLPSNQWPILVVNACALIAIFAIVQELEAFYRRVYSLEDKVPTFPKNYPTSALVGCVDIVDIVQVRSQAGQVEQLVQIPSDMHMTRTLGGNWKACCVIRNFFEDLKLLVMVKSSQHAIVTHRC